MTTWTKAQHDTDAPEEPGLYWVRWRGMLLGILAVSPGLTISGDLVTGWLEQGHPVKLSSAWPDHWDSEMEWIPAEPPPGFDGGRVRDGSYRR